MSKETEIRLAELIEKKLDGSISEAEHRALEDLLVADQSARKLYLDLTLQHATLENAGESLIQDELHTTVRLGWRFVLPAAATLVAAVCVALLVLNKISSPKPVATLVSCDHASWESSLPTTPGSILHPGFLKLKSGIATIRFHSGAEMIVEAPAHLVLENSMKARLYEGSVVVDVPKQAIGFEVETPDGLAIDLGTEFAVSVASGKSVFEVLTGEIEIEHAATKEKINLLESEIAIPAETGWQRSLATKEDGLLPNVDGALRIEADGNEKTLIRGDLPDRVHPDLLMAKKSSFLPDYDRKSIFSFDLSEVDRSKIGSARIRLNLVPSGLGYSARLPEVSRFSIYGFTNRPIQSWSDIPTKENMEMLGSFEISRGQRFGSFGINGDSLVQFLANHESGGVTFLVERNTDEADGNGLVHAFAAGSHPEASGPSLEIKPMNAE